MAYIRLSSSGRYTARVRVKGYPDISMTFRTKRDAIDWAGYTEDQMRRGVYPLREKNQTRRPVAVRERLAPDLTGFACENCFSSNHANRADQRLKHMKDDYVKAQIDSGHYTNDSEYICDLILREQECRPEIEGIRAALIEGESRGATTLRRWHLQAPDASRTWLNVASPLTIAWLGGSTHSEVGQMRNPLFWQLYIPSAGI